MNVSAIESNLSTLLGAVSSPTTTSTGTSTWGITDIFESSSTSSNAYQANTYNQLGTSLTATTLGTYSLTLNQTAVSLATVIASERQSEVETELLNEAVELLEAGDLDGAREVAQGMLDEDGQNASAAHVMGRTYLAENDYDQAERYFERASLLASSSDRFASDLANVRMLKGSDEEVLDEATRMIRQPDLRSEGIRLLGYLADRSPDNGEAHMLLGDALLEEGMATAAVASYRNALVVAEDDTLEGLVERCRSLVSLAPDVGVAHSLLGQALQKQGDYDEAMVELQRAADLVPENTSYQTAIASVYGDLGREALADRRPNEAIHHFEAGLAIDPTSDTLKGGLAQAHLDVSKWWLARGVEDKAFTELCAAKQHAPSDDEDLGADLAQAFNQLGDRYRYQEESDWAISCYQRAFDLDATNTAYRSELATAYDTRGSERFDTGEYELAEADYQAAVDLYPGRQSYLDHLQAAQDAQ